MIKRYIVSCKINIGALNNLSVIVLANSERKAKMKAIFEFYKKRYFHAKIISCKEIGGNENEGNTQ